MPAAQSPHLDNQRFNIGPTADRGMQTRTNQTSLVELTPEYRQNRLWKHLWQSGNMRTRGTVFELAKARFAASGMCSADEIAREECLATFHTGYYKSWAQPLQLRYHDVILPGILQSTKKTRASFRRKKKYTLSPEIVQWLVTIIKDALVHRAWIAVVPGG